MNMTVKTPSGAYPIILQNGALATAGKWMDLSRRVLIVTDEGVPQAYAEQLAEQCQTPYIFRLAGGESCKTLDSFRLLLSYMLEKEFSRADCVVALGGGVMGDLAAFTASCYMRGIDFYNIPTTLLSQVDSSIGGKTAVDLDGVKNAVGSFYHPKAVLIDPLVLRSLDPRQISAGMAEVIKMALSRDASLFRLLETEPLTEESLPRFITGALQIKKQVVEEDPQEKGLRRILNFGHTIGHAIESYHAGALLHGECVAMGMIPFCTPEVQARLIPLLKAYDLPTEITESRDMLLPYLLHDKKAKKDKIAVVLCESIGSCRIELLSAQQILQRLPTISN